MSEQRPRVRDRDVLVAALLVVAGVIAFAWFSGLIQPIHNALGFAPVVIGAMVVVTVTVLFRALRPR